MTNPKLKLAAALIAMFVIGAVTGIAFKGFLHPYGGPSPNRDRMHPRLLGLWKERLNLTLDQESNSSRSQRILHSRLTPFASSRPRNSPSSPMRPTTKSAST